MTQHQPEERIPFYAGTAGGVSHLWRYRYRESESESDVEPVDARTRCGTPWDPAASFIAGTENCPRCQAGIHEDLIFTPGLVHSGAVQTMARPDLLRAAEKKYNEEEQAARRLEAIEERIGQRTRR